MLWLNIPFHLGEYPVSLVYYPDISLVGKDRSHSRQVLPTMNIYKRISINLILCTRPHTHTHPPMEWERHAGMDHVWWGEKCDEDHITDSEIKLGIRTHQQKILKNYYLATWACCALSAKHSLAIKNLLRCAYGFLFSIFVVRRMHVCFTLQNLCLLSCIQW